MKPYVLWGEHRTTEPMSLMIAQELMNDPELAHVGFIEYEEWKLSDYVSILFQKLEAEKNGLSINDLEKDLMEKEAIYEKSLRDKYGPLVFNLHDGNKKTKFNYNHDMELWLTTLVDENIKDLIKGLCNCSKLNIQVQDNIKSLEEQITVEFMRPEIPFYYTSREISELDSKFNGVWAERAYHHKVCDTNNMIFQYDLKQYTKFMKSLLLNSK